MSVSETVRRIKRQTQPPLVIVLLTDDLPVYRLLAERAGADGCIAKSEFGSQLLPLINQLSQAKRHLPHRRDIMGFEQYHEPAHELPQEIRTFARLIVSLTEETEAINWYEQRIAVEKDDVARSIMQDAQQEEFKHFGMDLEFLMRRTPKWRAVLKAILFQEGDIVQLGKAGEKAVEESAG